MAASCESLAAASQQALYRPARVKRCYHGHNNNVRVDISFNDLGLFLSGQFKMPKIAPTSGGFTTPLRFVARGPKDHPKHMRTPRRRQCPGPRGDLK